MTAPDPTTTEPLPGALDRHLSANTRDDLPGLAAYIDRGAVLVTPDALAALRRLRRPLQAKIDELTESVQLQRRLELLATYFDEACHDGHHGTLPHREIAFALLYFLKGRDRIPDSIPVVGLLDDAMIVQIVLQRHSPVLRAHWLRRRRAWPAGF